MVSGASALSSTAKRRFLSGLQGSLTVLSPGIARTTDTFCCSGSGEGKGATAREAERDRSGNNKGAGNTAVGAVAAVGDAVAGGEGSIVAGV